MFFKRANTRARSGLTLVELTVSIGVGSIVIAALVSFTIYTARGFAMSMNYIELESQSRAALDNMTKEIRQTLALTGFNSNTLVFRNPDASSLAYLYDPTNRTLVRSNSSGVTKLLTECDSLSFSIFQRNTISNTFDQFPTTLQASNCKVVQLNWTCSRKILGSKLNTETVQSMKTVIRQE